ncbi:general transcription factor 3C polypeptide 1 isoform X2 [Copidosoma floridanum]|uniref:general transcription factor 3C polypeptide 1 isoform X2 n=1 Tax=Copidosoma floridanum TaxID=29053 RepID=UPI0006C9B10E|nr:general transcription factor 3C polypeptide 1 isoform X2 [Copidosoma floridanum]
MNLQKPINLVDILIDEISLEGLDGITLEALWQRLSIRLEEQLPLARGFMEQIWGLCLALHDFSFFELEKPRNKLIIFDHYELEYFNSDLDKMYDEKEIYEHCPVEDPKLGVKGSCATYHTRKNVKSVVENLSLSDVEQKYGSKLVIVASQGLRERALIDYNVNPTLQLSLLHYCLLERIGRTRYLGDVTIKKSSSIKEDAKTLFYIRKGLLENGLIRKQVYYQGNTGLSYSGQNMGTLVHLTRFFNTRRPKVIIWAAHLIDYLKSRENYAAEYSEVKAELNLDYSIKKFFKIHLLQKLFKTDVKVPYRSYYPNCLEKDWQTKSKTGKERIVKLVTLANPNIDVNDLWRSEEIKEEENDHCILDVRNQKLNVPFLRQAYDVIEASGCKGISQMELASILGLTKLISRTIVRNLVKTKVVSTYIDDIGRQRTTKFVSRKWDEKNTYKKQMEEEISKIKEYSRSVQIDKNKEVSNDSAVHHCGQNIQEVIEETPEIQPPTSETSNLPINGFLDNFQLQLFSTVNRILKKYELFNQKNRYKYTSSENCSKLSSVRYKRMIDRKNQCYGPSSSTEKPNIVESDFYKMIETKLVVQKPECKKKSQKVAVVGFMENLDNTDISLNVSYRLIHRANMIIESVKQHKVIEDTQKLMRYINEVESKEGFEAKIDKNSLLRLLQKLAEDNLIKYIQLVLKNKKHVKQKTVNFICDPSVDINDSLIQSAVEQAKLKYCMSASLHNPYNSDETTINTDFPKLTSLLKKSCNTALENQGVFKKSSVARVYGYCPKFLRLKHVHIFLYYLIYGHSGKTVPKRVFLENLQNEDINVDDALDCFPILYSEEVDWKMFIPPLPKHRGYQTGWALMADVHLRMPLSLFVKIVNVNFEIPGLQEILAHPIQRHYLVKDIPTPIRNLLFFKRKYIFSTHEIVTRLCYLGLCQFGPQKLKEKDQVFVYLNRNTELLDTTSSSPGYHRIEDKPYPSIKYCFTSMPVVENYWYEMWNICINTCLGGRLVVQGKDILLEDLVRKPEMIQATKVRIAEEVESHDTGLVPGDRKGAAGIDSAFFSHLKRNWNWINNNSLLRSFPNNLELRSVKANKPDVSVMQKRIARPKKRISLLQKSLSKSLGSVKSAMLSKFKLKPVRISKTTGKLLPPAVFPQMISSKPSKIIRKVLPRKQKRKRVKYDEIDFSALQRMDKLRVDWEIHEDNILLVCKVAMMYLCPNPRRNVITFSAIRDVLRAYSFTSLNKTSKACQRRLLYMLKQPSTTNSVLLAVEEVKQDFYVNKRFGGIVDKLKIEYTEEEYEQKVEKIFHDLVAYIARKYYNISNMEHREPIVLPKTVQEFNLYHELKLPTRTIKSPGISKEVHELNDIHTCTINSIIHSSMCCGKERRSWAYQLFNVYQQYPENLLRNAMLKIRADKMVTMKKSYMCANKKFGNCMPMSSSQYQLSSCYYYKFQTKWPYQIFSETYNILLTLLENYVERKSQDGKLDDGVEVKPDDGGIIATLHDYLGTNIFDVDIDIPEQIIMLDPGLPQKHEVFQRIAVRYQAILNALGMNSVKDSQSQEEILLEDINDETSTKQQSEVESRSLKRTRKKNEGTFQTKKRKFNNKKVLPSTSDSWIDKVTSDTPSLDDEIQAILEGVTNRIEFSQTNSNENHSVNDTSLQSFSFEPQDSSNDCTNTDAGLPNFSCDWLDDFQKTIPNESSTENVQSVDSVVAEKDNRSSTRLTASNASENKKASSTRVNELVKRAMNNAKSTMIENLETRNEVQDARTKQTRIAMLQMREELHDLTIDDNHHAYEYFVVNSFKLLYSLVSNEENENDITDYQGMKLPRKLLPVDIKLVNKILEDVKKHAVFPKEQISLDDLKTEIEQDGLFQWNDVVAIHRFIKSKAEFGATLHELVTEFFHSCEKLAEISTFLVEKRVVLRAGIVTVRYIHHRYINPWIIRSYKILRLEKESHQTVPEGSVYLLDTSENLSNKDKENNRVYNATNLFYAPPLKSLNNINFNKSDTANDSERDLEAPSSKCMSKIRQTQECDSLEPKRKKICSETDGLDGQVKISADVVQTEINIDDSCVRWEEANDNCTTTGSNMKVDGGDTAQKKKTNEDNQESLMETSDSINNYCEGQRKSLRQITLLSKQNDVNKAAKLIDFNKEEIKVVIKPWIRIDGVLNRRVLDRMLGAVLCYCIERPGLSLTSVQNRFSPALQPYHTRELIEILVKLGCVKTIVQKVTKVTLFSKPGKIDFSGNPNLVANSNNYIIEPDTQCALKFGMFLSNRSYNFDFLS